MKPLCQPDLNNKILKVYLAFLPLCLTPYPPSFLPSSNHNLFDKHDLSQLCKYWRGKKIATFLKTNSRVLASPMVVAQGSPGVRGERGQKPTLWNACSFTFSSHDCYQISATLLCVIQELGPNWEMNRGETYMTRGEAWLHLHASCTQPQQVRPRDQGKCKADS